jgi:2-keto-4-pentenoate hydratase/2-oxohepta-3-ene-1,7-dioic acid hydratase in catechol pathway
MKDGKMMVMKGGNTMDMSQDMTLTNGTTVATDGTVKMKNGKTMKMKDGDAMYMNGKMEKMKMKEKEGKM